MTLFDKKSPQNAPTATVAIIASGLLSQMSPMDEGSDFARARSYYLEVKAKGENTTPNEWHRYRMQQAVSLAWELVEMVDDMRPVK